MKQWINKLLDQLDLNWSHTEKEQAADMSEERATLLYFLDIYSKYLMEIEGHSLRRTREQIDEYAKMIVNPENPTADKTLFRLRQFFSSYRVDEYTYVQKTFEDFKGIIWDFADQLGEDAHFEKSIDGEIRKNLEGLREAVEANSIEGLRAKSREFIDFYVELSSRKEQRFEKKMTSIEKNLHSMKKQLLQANETMRLDHLTGACNRKCFDEQSQKYLSLGKISGAPVTMIMIDIDYFKRINDTYGHDTGDFILKECVLFLKQIFNREVDFVARIGGEEFAVILPDYQVEHAVKKAEEALKAIRKEVFVQGDMQIRFTVSMGIAQLMSGENVEQWLRRADTALYLSKQTGRDKYTIAPHSLTSVA